MREKLIIPVMILLLALAAAGCGAGPAGTPGGAKKIAVVATIYPLADFASQVGGDRVQVTCLVPAGVEPHDWEPAPRDMARIAGAQVFIYNGAGMEPWVDSQVSMLQGKGVKVVEASQGLDLISAAGAGNRPGAVDPHIWLDPVQAQKIVARIRDALISVDPKEAAYYSNRAQAYLEKLAVLDREYAGAVKTFHSRDIVTSHDAFAYLARRYGLRQLSVTGLSPDSEPDPAQMAALIAFCREHKVKYIFTEKLVSPRLADTLAREAGASTLVLDPIEGLTAAEQSRGENYLLIMRQNLANLKKALGE
ncbi:metal ABC transporter substrate-binding protein [Desulfotomaculum copahuensis]|uniref:ABC transporter substrate-binding protein n=1 Tax=Desulfotomaculum copahuensis TaxID=1838280 RepID=A0A1B7LBE1_9FIRM|nr:metal ABC transporter substrate-binding protein [Desulfotomaculum copahuensis]OAT79769.1 ABC transporter substrate-binding protein [Desulfotomaculum copahuensis]